MLYPGSYNSQDEGQPASQDIRVTSTTPGAGTRWLNNTPPEALFVLSAIAQYTGAVIAVLLFDEVEPQTVAWFRVIGAAVALLAVSNRWWRGWTKSQLIAVSVFGVTTALMNIFFYLAISRIDLGKGVTIEFVGPIAVAALSTRSARNSIALMFAISGVVLLGGVEVDRNPYGLLFILLASAMWAAYIVIGSKVAQVDRGVAGLGLGLAVGAVLTAPAGAPWSGPVWLSPRLVGLCLVVGVFSSAIGYGLDQVAMRRIPIRRFSLLLALLPATATLVGWVTLGQQPSRLDAVGILLVLIGVASQEREELSKSDKEPD